MPSEGWLERPSWEANFPGEGRDEKYIKMLMSAQGNQKIHTPFAFGLGALDDWLGGARFGGLAGAPEPKGREGTLEHEDLIPEAIFSPGVSPLVLILS